MIRTFHGVVTMILVNRVGVTISGVHQGVMISGVQEGVTANGVDQGVITNGVEPEVITNGVEPEAITNGVVTINGKVDGVTQVTNTGKKKI